MEIVWLGHSCFRIRGREATVVTDPCPPSTGYTIGKPTADIVTVSQRHDDHSYMKAIASHPVVLDSPGEYEIHGAFLTGIRTHHDSGRGSERGENIAFVIEMEDIRICHLGDLGHTPTAGQAEDMTGVDVLLVPVGGGSTIDAPKAAEVVSLLEARLVIPMPYRTATRRGTFNPPTPFRKGRGVQAATARRKSPFSAATSPPRTQA